MLDDTGLGALDGVLGTFSNEGAYQIAAAAPDSDEGFSSNFNTAF